LYKRKLLNIRRRKTNYLIFFFSFTLENRRLGTVVGAMARSFEKELYLEEVNI